MTRQMQCSLFLTNVVARDICMFKIDYTMPELTSNAQPWEYWKNRLDQGDAYVMSLHDDLIDKFDFPLPCISVIDYTPDQDDYDVLLPSLDKWLFGGKLSKCQLKCSDLCGMLFDVQTCLLEVGIFERGIDSILCNSMSFSILRHDSQDNAYVVKQQILFNKDIYKDIKFTDFVHDAAHAMSFCNEVMQNADQLHSLASKHDFAALENFFSKDFDVKSSQLAYAKGDSIKHIDASFECLKLMGEDFDDGVFMWNDSKNAVLRKDIEGSDLLVVHAE